MDDDEKREDSLTDDEARDVEERHVTGEEAHREGEFDDLRDLIKGVYDRLDGMEDAFSKRLDVIKETGIAKAVENGATVREDENLDLDDIPELDELNLSLS